ncbi:MAG TPA: 16S rRNA (guanine(527)-N(7))-methyltransferase RsmG [Vicinamibacterales bacterium]|jgi:16S rRNA (guanine527-N7)-methyltransferase
MLDPLEAYLRLLTHWNAKINLTALPLDPPTDQTFDRLLVEPLGASRHIEDRPLVWFDLGSGGGSPAIPMKIARPVLNLTMVESKERKAAFLREAIRTLDLTNSNVRNERFEDLAEDPTLVGNVDLVTVRAVKTDAGLFETAAKLLREGGRLFLFRPAHDPSANPNGFKLINTAKLAEVPPSFLCIYNRVFHVEQRR